MKLTGDVFKPTLLKLFVTFFLMIFFVVSFSYVTIEDSGLTITHQGIPLSYFDDVAKCPLDSKTGNEIACDHLNYLFLIVDFVLWYLIGAVLTELGLELWNKRKKKRRHRH